MNLDLKGKNALVCGSSKGIGEAIAIELAHLGANIVLAARSLDKLETVCALLDISKGQKHDVLQVDFNDSANLKISVKKIVDKQPIHILINNTGGPKGGSILNANPEEFAEAFHNHLVCSQILTQVVVDGMKKEKFGRIINIISTSVKQPIDGLGVSNTIRGAVANWAKTMANELGPHGITVNNVLPGSTETGRLDQILENKAKMANDTTDNIAKKMKEVIPVKRFARPEEIAFAVAFLASKSADYITGINLPVDGGRTKNL